MDKIILAGGSGFLGRELAQWYAERGREPVILSRAPAGRSAGRTIAWDAKTLGPWVGELEDAAMVINLAGRSVNCRYNESNRRQMMDSRIYSTRVLGEAIRACASPPRVWCNLSTATIYKHSYERSQDEKSGEIASHPEAKDEYSIQVAQAWEKEFQAWAVPGTRKVILRASMVFGSQHGGVYEVLRRLVRFGLGGRMGHGRQYVSWIEIEDFCRVMDWLESNPNADGIYNVCAPNPVPNKEMMSILRKVLGMPFGLPAARWMLEVGAFLLRTETELIVKSRRVVPERLLHEGFEFKYAQLEEAIRALEEKIREHA